MANYYTDHPEYDFYLNHPEMQRVVELKERNYADKDKFEDAPVDFEDAIENYKRVLEITGDIAAKGLCERIGIDASKTYDNIEATRQAGLWVSLCLAATMALTCLSLRTLWLRRLFRVQTQASRTSGRFRTVSRLSMSSVRRSSARSTFRVFAQARQCQWT